MMITRAEIRDVADAVRDYIVEVLEETVEWKEQSEAELEPEQGRLDLPDEEKRLALTKDTMVYCYCKGELLGIMPLSDAIKEYKISRGSIRNSIKEAREVRSRRKQTSPPLTFSIRERSM